MHLSYVRNDHIFLTQTSIRWCNIISWQNQSNINLQVYIHKQIFCIQSCIYMHYLCKNIFELYDPSVLYQNAISGRKRISYVTTYHQCTPPWMFLPLDIPSEYRPEHVTFGLLCVIFKFPSRIFCRRVPGFATDCPCGVWCRGLTTCLLYVGPPLEF